MDLHSKEYNDSRFLLNYIRFKTIANFVLHSFKDSKSSEKTKKLLTYAQNSAIFYGMTLENYSNCKLY